MKKKPVKKEVKSLQEVIKHLSTLKGIDLSDAKELLKNLLKHTMNITGMKSAFLVKSRRNKFYPQIHCGAYNLEKIEGFLRDFAGKLDDNQNKEYIKGKFIYKINADRKQTFWLFIPSRTIPGEENKEIFRLFLKASANILENAENCKKYLEKEKIAAIGLAANMLIHDFKNPLGAIESITTVIKETSVDETVLECVDIIREATEGLNSMIKEILDFSRGKKDLELESTSLSGLIIKIEELLSSQLSQNRIKFEVKCFLKEEIIVDKKKLERVLINLIRNSIEALKGKKKDKKITLQIEKKKTKVRFSLSDNGQGIPEDIRESLFEPFVTKHTSGGTGLGMAIVKQIIESHKGEITFETRAGEGTTFVFNIPLKQ